MQFGFLKHSFGSRCARRWEGVGGDACKHAVTSCPSVDALTQQSACFWAHIMWATIWQTAACSKGLCFGCWAVGETKAERVRTKKPCKHGTKNNNTASQHRTEHKGESPESSLDHRAYYHITCTSARSEKQHTTPFRTQLPHPDTLITSTA